MKKSCPFAKEGEKKTGLKKKKMQKKIHKVMSEFKEGDLHSGSKKGPKVKERKQALAIGLNYMKPKNRNNKKSNKK